MKRILFFLGKGGVGKTTSSASLAYYLAHKGEKVYWVSVDPAHNICDIIGCSSFQGVKQIESNLFAEEIDTDRYTEEYIKTNISRMKRNYQYLEIINLEKAFDILKYSPGIEEAAIMYALTEALKTYHETMDYIVVDTPPTGLMLKIFALPFTSSIWIERLGEWREKILDRRRTINAIKVDESPYRGIDSEKDNDPVMRELGMQMDKVDFLKNIFLDRSLSSMILVLNQDRLSLHESSRIKDGLRKFKMEISIVLLNKFGMIDETEKHILESFKDIQITRLPYIKDHALTKEELMELAADWAQRVI